MSNRYLRKKLQEKEELQHQLSESGTVEAEAKLEEDSPSFQNQFDLLHDENDDEDLQENEAGNRFVRDVANRVSSMKATGDELLSTNHKLKKKKKKKSKEISVSSKNNTGDPSDLMFEDLFLEIESSNCRHCCPHPLKGKLATLNGGDGMVKQCRSTILQVDPKFLRAENELRRIFGSKVVNSFEKSNQAGSSRQVRGGRRVSHSHRKSILVSPLQHWPRWDGSLSMELLETRDGYHYFRYVHSSSYMQAQNAFEAAKAMHDLNAIANFHMYNSYHIDALLTMAEVLKFSGEHQMSTEYIALCLYALECAWHPMFTPLQGNCQLKYVHETNKPLFTALFTHMKNMDRRGCHRSALEICKLLLALDSDDPMGAMFCIDYFALRAEEYTWLERFSDEYKSDNSLWLFPNFSYSLAVCRFCLEREVGSKDTGGESGKASSMDLMKQALMLHPSVLKKLVAKVPLKDQIWIDILKNCFFCSDKSGSPSLDHLINIYVERNYIIWRLPDLQKFLRDSALQVIETLKHTGSDAKDWACVRKEAFSSETNEYSHLMVSDFSDSIPTMPPEDLQNLMMRDVNIGNQVANPVGDVPAPRNVADRNPLTVLFESILPWVDYGRRDAEDDQHNGAE